jgi:hypothetical protein
MDMKYVTAAVLTVVVSLGVANVTAGELSNNAMKAHAVIGNYLETHPEMIIDLADVSGEYCVNTWEVNGGHMTHYALDPSKTTEDIVDFVTAQSFIDSGIDVTKLPRMPSKLGAMENGQWYYLPEDAVGPHHGEALGLALLVRATEIQ